MWFSSLFRHKIITRYKKYCKTKIPQDNTFSVLCLLVIKRGAAMLSVGTLTELASPLLNLPNPDSCCLGNTLALGTQMQQIYKIFHREDRSNYHILKSQAMKTVEINTKRTNIEISQIDFINRYFDFSVCIAISK